jgi:hypothetical protein
MYRLRTPVRRSPLRLLIVSASEALLFPAVRHFSERGFRGPAGVGRRETPPSS